MKSTKSVTIVRLILWIVLAFSLFVTSSSVPTFGKKHHLLRKHRQLGFGEGMEMSFSESMAMAASLNDAFGGNGMSMSESLGMAVDAGVRNVNGFPVPYFDASMSMAEANSFNFRTGR